MSLSVLSEQEEEAESLIAVSEGERPRPPLLLRLGPKMVLEAELALVKERKAAFGVWATPPESIDFVEGPEDECVLQLAVAGGCSMLPAVSLEECMKSVTSFRHIFEKAAAGCSSPDFEAACMPTPPRGAPGGSRTGTTASTLVAADHARPSWRGL